MKFLVTGGCGFIGGHLVRALVQAGNEATILDVDVSPSDAHPTPGVEIVHGSVVDRSTLARAVRDCAGIFHLAALSTVAECEADPNLCRETNVGGTEEVLLAARQQGGIPVVYASSAAVYGEHAERHSRERDQTDPLSFYAKSKVDVENLACSAFDAFGQRSVGLRFFNVYGPSAIGREPRGVVAKFVAKALADESVTIFGDGEQVRDFVAVSDAVRHLLAAMKLDRKGAAVLNVCTGVGTSINSLVDIIREVGGRPLRVVREPAMQADIHHSVGDPTFANELLNLGGAVPFRSGIENVAAALCAECPTVE